VGDQRVDGLTAWCCRTPARPRASAALAAEYALVVLGMLLFSERTWKHHGVTLVLPFAVLCYALSAHWPKQRTRTFVIGALIVAQVALSTTSTGLMPDEWAKLAQVYGAYTWAFMLLAAAVVVVLRRGATASAVAIRPDAISRAA
jgi:alpha-1,2-mannosyltransferase